MCDAGDYSLDLIRAHVLWVKDQQKDLVNLVHRPSIPQHALPEHVGHGLYLNLFLAPFAWFDDQNRIPLSHACHKSMVPSFNKLGNITTSQGTSIH